MRVRPITERYTAFEFVNLDEIRLADPVLNFEDGSKMRVYQNGDASYMIVESASKIEKHDKRYVRKRFHAPSNKSLMTAPRGKIYLIMMAAFS